MREDFFDPDLANVSITISEISVSPDLSNARVYTMPLGGMNVDVILPALNTTNLTFGQTNQKFPNKPNITNITKYKIFLIDILISY